MATHFRNLKIKDLRKETADCISVAFEIPVDCKEEFHFYPGQNITIRKNLGGEELRRSYSICSSPMENELRIAIKKNEGGRFSTFANKEFRKGDLLDVLPPTGTFFTKPDPHQSKNYLALAAGSGITPVLSIIKASLATETKSSFTLVYGNRDRQSIIFREALEGIKNRYVDRFSLIHILSREKTEIPLHSGRIDQEKCRVLFDKLIDLRKIDEIFLCGPGEMISGVQSVLRSRDFPENHVHFELFTVPGQSAGPGTVSPPKEAIRSDKKSRVTVMADGISFVMELAYDGDTVLDAALKTGADLPFACKGGVCASCKARLVEGKVEMENNYALEKDELDAGFILTCQSHPRSESLKVDYDSK